MFKRLSRKILAAVPIDVFGQIERPLRLSILAVSPTPAANSATTLLVSNGAGVPFFQSVANGSVGLPAVFSTAIDLGSLNLPVLPFDLWINPGDTVTLTSSVDGEVVAVYEDSGED